MPDSANIVTYITDVKYMERIIKSIHTELAKGNHLILFFFSNGPEIPRELYPYISNRKLTLKQMPGPIDQNPQAVAYEVGRLQALNPGNEYVLWGGTPQSRLFQELILYDSEIHKSLRFRLAENRNEASSSRDKKTDENSNRRKNDRKKDSGKNSVSKDGSKKNARDLPSGSKSISSAAEPNRPKENSRITGNGESDSSSVNLKDEKELSNKVKGQEGLSVQKPNNLKISEPPPRRTLRQGQGKQPDSQENTSTNSKLSQDHSPDHERKEKQDIKLNNYSEKSNNGKTAEEKKAHGPKSEGLSGKTLEEVLDTVNEFNSSDERNNKLNRPHNGSDNSTENKNSVKEADEKNDQASRIKNMESQVEPAVRDNPKDHSEDKNGEEDDMSNKHRSVREQNPGIAQEESRRVSPQELREEKAISDMDRVLADALKQICHRSVNQEVVSAVSLALSSLDGVTVDGRKEVFRETISQMLSKRSFEEFWTTLEPDITEFLELFLPDNK